MGLVMSNDYDIIKKILDTDEADKIRTTVENFQLVEMPDKVVEYVTSKLLSDDNGVKDTITRILSHNKNPNIPKFLVPYVSSENIAARNLAGEILLNRRNESIEAMINYLPSANDDDQKFIIDILGLIGDPKPADEIVAVLKVSNDDNVILACIEALGNMKSEKGLDLLVPLYEQKELFRPTIIEAMGKIRSAECVKFLNSNYYGVDELTKFSLIESFGEIGNQESFNMLINDIQYHEGAYKWVAIENIGKLEEKYGLELPSDIALKNSLIETLESADYEYKKAAVRLVSMFNDQEVFEKVLTIYGNDILIDQKLQDYFSKNIKMFFKVTSKYINEEMSNTKPLLEVLKELLGSCSGESLQGLDEFELRSYVVWLTENLTHSDEEVRSNSMEILFYIDLEAALMFSDVMMEDSVVWNRLKLLDIIQYCEHPKITEIIQTMANDREEMVRENAQTILNERGISILKLRDK
jgi:HEAT repeat protein